MLCPKTLVNAPADRCHHHAAPESYCAGRLAVAAPAKEQNLYVQYISTSTIKLTSRIRKKSTLSHLHHTYKISGGGIKNLSTTHSVSSSQTQI